ncbi:MAG: asparagine synthase (glutamine-hydrolyzing) [Victivallales bacterium]|nr:asparagine synthase (glutamine-hydrolyzing) [Victivallales bacterium]
MCGICGIINFDNSHTEKELLERMNNTIHHRGPDDSGSYLYQNIGIAHRRLSIIDLSSGHQPITNEDSTLWIVFNGEIYNYTELRSNLILKGHIFKTNTDTEVIIHLYEELGPECLSELQGMFALAVLDKRKNELFLARDRMGQKPLYYALHNNTFVFASELQAVVEHPKILKEINFTGLHDYLTLQYIPAPNTIYKNIFKLLPANYMLIKTSSRELKLSNYWKCEFKNKISISYEDAKAEVRNLTEQAVEKRLMSDVPLGVFLSGGIDSSIVAGLASKKLNNPLKTFTIGFSNSKYDERSYAGLAAEYFKTEHYEKKVDPADFSIVESLVNNYGEPYADSSMLPTFLLSKFAGEKITVALSGDGADEVFAGYYRYLVYLHSLKFDFIPPFLRKKLARLLSGIIPTTPDERSFKGKFNRILKMWAEPRNHRYLQMISRVTESTKHSVLNRRNRTTQKYFEELCSEFTAENPVEKLMELDINTYLPNDILPKIDIASMANSIELRSPFLDHKLIEFINSLPFEYKIKHSKRKRILVDAFSDLIPELLVNRKKMGFGVPVASWLRNEWSSLSEDLILSGSGIKDCGFSSVELEKILKQHRNKTEDHSYLIWSLMIFELWYNRFMK